MEKLKVKFKRLNNVILAKIIHQDESLRVEGEKARRGEYFIKSLDCPEIYGYSFCIRGKSVKNDTDIETYTFKNKKKAKTWLKNIKEMIEEINATF